MDIILYNVCLHPNFKLLSVFNCEWCPKWAGHKIGDLNIEWTFSNVHNMTWLLILPKMTNTTSEYFGIFAIFWISNDLTYYTYIRYRLNDKSDIRDSAIEAKIGCVSYKWLCFANEHFSICHRWFGTMSGKIEDGRLVVATAKTSIRT